MIPLKLNVQERTDMRLIENDGGRAKAGYKGITGECVVRAISIAIEKPYQEVYDNLFEA